jgi:hypothetical protein
MYRPIAPVAGFPVIHWSKPRSSSALRRTAGPQMA